MTPTEILPQWARMLVAFTPPVGMFVALAFIVRAIFVNRGGS